MNKYSYLAASLHVIFVTLWPAVSPADTSLTCVPMGPPESIALSFSEATQSKCGTYLDAAGQDATFCQWSFAYRTAPAKEAFLSAQETLDGCYDKTLPAGGTVNHPDSYDQVFYSAEPQVISLSLKDKAQHKATYLFLRVETAP